MITIKWSLWSDSHRRIQVYKTRPVAAEAQRQNGVHGRSCTCVFRLSAGCSALELRDEFELRLHTKAPHRTKGDARLRRRSDANGMIWFIALTKEQLALITDHWFHGISFRGKG